MCRVIVCFSGQRGHSGTAASAGSGPASGSHSSSHGSSAAAAQRSSRHSSPHLMHTLSSQAHTLSQTRAAAVTVPKPQPLASQALAADIEASSNIAGSLNRASVAELLRIEETTVPEPVAQGQFARFAPPMSLHLRGLRLVCLRHLALIPCSLP